MATILTFEKPLVHGRLLRRYKRFLADVELDAGELITAHCTNSGSMKTCLEIGAEVYLSEAGQATRKTRFTWEMIRTGDCWTGINTAMANKLAALVIGDNHVPGLDGFDTLHPEVRFGESRLDFLAEKAGEKSFIEVKNVTYNEGGTAMFPDAVTARGLKHLQTLIRARQEGYRAAMLYIIQRADVHSFSPAQHIDPDYARMFEQAMKEGVEIFAFQFRVSPTGFEAEGLLPVKII